MNKIPVKKWSCLSLISLLLLLAYPQADSYAAGPDTLWKIVNQCVSNQRSKHDPQPCARVNLQQNYVLLNDINGSLQYLLLPIQHISGMESALLLNPETTNYFAAAWHNRDLLSKRYGKLIQDKSLSLAINSEYGRTQNQLHIHISCIRPQLRQQLWQQYPELTTQWQPVANGIDHHQYWARRLNSTDLAKHSPFILLASGIKAAKNHMGKYGLALLSAPDGNFILLTTRVQLLKANMASIEEIQDHHCTELY